MHTSGRQGHTYMLTYIQTTKHTYIHTEAYIHAHI